MIGRWHIRSVDTMQRDFKKRIDDLLEDGWEPYAVTEYGAGIDYHFRKFIEPKYRNEEDNG